MDASVPRPHQGGWYLATALLGLVLPLLMVWVVPFGVQLMAAGPFLSIVAIVRCRRELIGIRSGAIDASGRTITRVALVIGLVGACLWIALFGLLAIALAHGGGVGPL